MEELLMVALLSNRLLATSDKPGVDLDLDFEHTTECT